MAGLPTSNRSSRAQGLLGGGRGGNQLNQSREQNINADLAAKSSARRGGRGGIRNQSPASIEQIEAARLEQERIEKERIAAEQAAAQSRARDEARIQSQRIAGQVRSSGASLEVAERGGVNIRQERIGLGTAIAQTGRNVFRNVKTGFSREGEFVDTFAPLDRTGISFKVGPKVNPFGPLIVVSKDKESPGEFRLKEDVKAGVREDLQGLPSVVAQERIAKRIEKEEGQRIVSTFQQGIDLGTVSYNTPEEQAKVNQQVNEVFQAKFNQRFSSEFGTFSEQRKDVDAELRRRETFSLGKVTKGTAIVVGTAAGSLTTGGAVAVAGVSAGLGARDIIIGSTAQDLTFGQRAGRITLGAAQVGVGLFGASSILGPTGTISRQINAARLESLEAQKLESIGIETVRGSKGSQFIISGGRQVGDASQEITFKANVLRRTDGSTNVIIKEGVSKTRIPDFGTGRFIETVDFFSGGANPISAGKVRVGKVGRIRVTKEIPDVQASVGKGFISRPGSKKIDEFTFGSLGKQEGRIFKEVTIRPNKIRGKKFATGNSPILESQTTSIIGSVSGKSRIVLLEGSGDILEEAAESSGFKIIRGGGRKSSPDFLTSLYKQETQVNSLGGITSSVSNKLLPKTAQASQIPTTSLVTRSSQGAFAGQGLYERTDEGAVFGFKGKTTVFNRSLADVSERQVFSGKTAFIPLDNSSDNEKVFGATAITGRASQGQSNRQNSSVVQLPATSTLLIQQPMFPKTPTPNLPRFPNPRFTFDPFFGGRSPSAPQFGDGLSKIRVRTVPLTGYTPSVTAAFLGIRGKRPSKIAGGFNPFQIRALPTLPRSRKRIKK